MTVDWSVCGMVVFLSFGVVSVGWISEIFCCVVVGIVSTFSWFADMGFQYLDVSIFWSNKTQSLYGMPFKALKKLK